MGKDIIMNIAIIVSYIFIMGQLFQVVRINEEFETLRSRRKHQLLAGLFLGILGILLMSFSIQVTEYVIVDLRHISILIAAVFFGGLAALLSSSIIGLFRLLFFGGVNDIAISAAIGILVIGIVCALLTRLPMHRGLKSFVMNLGSIVIIYIDLYINLVWLSGNHQLLLPIYSVHWSLSITGGFIAYWVMRHIVITNQAYLSLEQSNSRLYSLINNLRSGILVESPKREIELFNDTFQDIYSLSYKEVYEGMSAINLELASSNNYEDPAFSKRVEQIVEERKVVLNEHLPLKDGRVIERDYIPVQSKAGRFLGHMWNFRDITEKKELENQLKENEQKYKSLFEHNQSATFITDIGGHFTALNESAKELTGYTKDELIHSSATPLIQKKKLNETLLCFKRLLQGESLTFQSSIIRKNGEEVYINVNAAPIIIEGRISGIIGIAHDVSKQKYAEQQLQLSEDRYRSLIQLSPAAIFVHSLKRIEFVNDQALRFTGAKKKEDLVGKKVFDFLHEEDKKSASYYFSLGFMQSDGLPKYHELKFVRLDGKIVTGDVGAKMIQYNGEPAVLGMIHDITEKKEMEEALRKANETLTKLAKLDGLTTIPNRRFFDETLVKELSRATRQERELSLLLLDIDQFKAFNDTYGHLEGDHCLKKVAHSIQKVLQRPSDFVARYGGEEFAIILPETDQEGAVQVAETVRQTIEDLKIPHINSSVHPFVTISIGCATHMPKEQASPSSLIERADEALYYSKENGRNQVNASFNLNKDMM